MYKITFSKNADRTLRKIPANISNVIIKKIKQLANNPFDSQNVKKLTSHPGYRLRVGNWRIIYTIENEMLIIHIININPRGGAYK